MDLCMIDPRFQHALRLIFTRLKGGGLLWAVTGSLGMALQGVDVTVHDIDLQTDESGAYEIERRLADFVIEQVAYKASERIRSHLGKLAIDDVEVEVMGAVQKLLPDGSWEQPVNIELHKRTIDYDGSPIPVLSLEYEYEAYRLMGRLEKANILGQHIERNRRE
jgi:hypothetical protein